ncbi:hypothetical protein ACEWYD_07885, partial [Helicobacter pylori]
NLILFNLILFNLILFNLILFNLGFYGVLAVKTTKIPLKTTQAEIPNISSVWVLHDKMKKA